MAAVSRPRTPQDVYPPVANMSHASTPTHGYASGLPARPESFAATNSIQQTDFHVRIGADDATPVPRQSRFREELSRRSSLMDSNILGETLKNESDAHIHPEGMPARASSTLKKKPSLSRKGSLRRAGSKRSSRAGSVRSLTLGEKEKYGIGEDEMNSAFYIPIPTKGSPTDVLANRFQAWRKVLKDLITAFREIQKSYETRAKSTISVSNAMNSISFPSTFLPSGGISEATNILKTYHRQALADCNKAKEVEMEIIVQLNSLRNDLQQKIKEIKSLASDFKNNVDKETEGTRKAVRHFHEALGLVDTDPAATSGKGDPFIIKLGVDKQVEKQLGEENYLHKAYLNLERSGRELESIVVGEIQKAYNAYAAILKREADSAYDAVDQLRDGPISMPRDLEWKSFVENTDQLIDSSIPVRNIQNIVYPGIDHPAAAEVRAGMLERKSKYLKSYTPGWYVLSPTHLHEFKSADRIRSQNPVMSLYLPEQKLGVHSQPDSSSHKFILKGRQTGAMHRGHSWMFRAESHDTMLAWYEDLKNLTEKTGEARNAFVRRHVRSTSGASFRAASISSDGVMDEDEADATPYSTEQMLPPRGASLDEPRWRSPPGGRFPSEVQLNRAAGEAPISPSSETSSRERALADLSLHETGLQFAGQPQNVPPFNPDQASTGQPELQTTPMRSASTRGPSRVYNEWMAAQPPEHNRLSPTNRLNSQSPDLSRSGTQLSTGAPVVVPGETGTLSPRVTEPDTPFLSTQPTNTDMQTIPTTTTATSLGMMNSRAPTNESAALPNGALSSKHPDGTIPDGEEEIPQMLSQAGRTSTVSDLKVPGQYPPTK